MCFMVWDQYIFYGILSKHTLVCCTFSHAPSIDSDSKRVFVHKLVHLNTNISYANRYTTHSSCWIKFDIYYSYMSSNFQFQFSLIHSLRPTRKEKLDANVAGHTVIKHIHVILLRFALQLLFALFSINKM